MKWWIRAIEDGRRGSDRRQRSALRCVAGNIQWAPTLPTDQIVDEPLGWPYLWSDRIEFEEGSFLERFGFHYGVEPFTNKGYLRQINVPYWFLAGFFGLAPLV